MNTTGEIIGAVHGLFGLLWIVMLLWLTVNLSAYKLTYREELNQGIRMSSVLARVTGGLAIIIGLILFAASSFFAIHIAVASISGIILLAGIVLAIIAYAVIGEGFLMRNLKRLDSENSSSTLRFSIYETLLAMITLVLMFVGTYL